MKKPVNLQTPNIIIAAYISGGGGKCILNCLGLSRHMVLQDSTLAQQQLAGQLTTHDKKNLLISRLEASRQHSVWHDLRLGCEQLFGIKELSYDNNYTQVPESFLFNSVIAELSDSDLRFGLVEHNYTRLEKKIRLWTNATVILFYNEIDFIKSNRPDWTPINIRLQEFWESVRGPDWPNQPPVTFSELAQLDPFVQQELKELFDNEILEYLYPDHVLGAIKHQDQLTKNRVMLTNTCLTWNCNWFATEELFIHNMKELYQQLKFDDFDPNAVSAYYTRWYDIIRKTSVPLPGVKTQAI